MAKDEFRYINVVFGMHYYWNCKSIVPDSNLVLFARDVDSDTCHLTITLVVVCRIHEDLVEYLVECRHVRYLPMLELLSLGVEHP